MTRIEAKLTELGITLPDVPTPAGVYVPAVRSGNYIYTSGQLPMKDGALAATGRLGAEISLDDGYNLARQAGLNALAAIKGVIGDLDQVVRIVKVTGFVNSAADFTDQPKVINGVSELFGEVFGNQGQHARSAVGVSALPMNTPVEVEVIAEVREDVTAGA